MLCQESQDQDRTRKEGSPAQEGIGSDEDNLMTLIDTIKVAANTNTTVMCQHSPSSIATTAVALLFQDAEVKNELQRGLPTAADMVAIRSTQKVNTEDATRGSSLIGIGKTATAGGIATSITKRIPRLTTNLKSVKTITIIKKALSALTK